MNQWVVGVTAFILTFGFHNFFVSDWSPYELTCWVRQCFWMTTRSARASNSVTSTSRWNNHVASSKMEPFQHSPQTMPSSTVWTAVRVLGLTWTWHKDKTCLSQNKNPWAVFWLHKSWWFWLVLLSHHIQLSYSENLSCRSMSERFLPQSCWIPKSCHAANHRHLRVLAADLT